MTTTPTDKNVEAVRERLAQRAARGLVTYGVTTERRDLTHLEWLQHLQDELLDAAVYVQRLKADPEPLTPELLERSGMDVSPCRVCGDPVITIPDGMPAVCTSCEDENG